MNVSEISFVKSRESIRLAYTSGLLIPTFWSWECFTCSIHFEKLSMFLPINMSSCLRSSANFTNAAYFSGMEFAVTMARTVANEITMANVSLCRQHS